MAVTKPEVHRMISKVNFSDSNRKPEQIKYLVKHYVGATGGAEANCKYFYDKFRGASSHFFVGHNGEIWQCVEENDTAWHVGASKYKHKECRNSNSIGVELCVKKDADGKWYYTEETKKAAVQLFAYLMEKYNIDASMYSDIMMLPERLAENRMSEKAIRNGHSSKRILSSMGKKQNRNSQQHRSRRLLQHRMQVFRIRLLRRVILL